jgi:hypothetical protein
MRRRVAAGLALALVALALGTFAAGEVGEVAVLRSFEADGTPHDTKLWVVDVDGTPWVRVARPGRAWFQRLQANPKIVLVRGGREQRCRPVLRTSPEERRRADAAFAAKYGWVDRWYGLLLRKDAVPVQLVPIDDAAPGAEESAERVLR